MLSIVKSMALHGLEGYLINVEVDVSAGLPYFEVVGLPDTSVKEAKERVKTAIKNSNIEFQSRRIIVNLSPANTKKEGSLFDLPIAIGILIATEKIFCKNIDEYAFIGELSLDGKLNRVNGVLPMCIEAANLGIKNIILPQENAKEAAIVKNINVLPAESLLQIVKYLNKEISINSEKVDIDKLFDEKNIYQLDFSEVKGQENIKRALEVAASGGHNCLLIGSPGSGKTMMARRIPTILPKLTFAESLEITKIHSIAGTLQQNIPLIVKRPFRAPHHTISSVSLIGGGRIPKPGEISLAHFGVLFLDELTEFNKNTLEVLRAPLEDKVVTISRINATLTYPCDCMFVASMNPCPCGFYGSNEKECTCSPISISKYINRISGPLLDRMDIQVEVSSVKYEKLDSNIKTETSEDIRERVNNARKIQLERYKHDGIFSNAQLTPKLMSKYCKLDGPSKVLMKNAFEKLGLSVRAHDRILKVARSIADLDNNENIQAKHIAEAIQYRSLDKKYWGN